MVLLSVISRGCSGNDSFEESSGKREGRKREREREREDRQGYAGSAFARLAVTLRELAKQPFSSTRALLT